MREVTKLLINNYKIKKLGYDFMGFSLQKKYTLSFHHLLLSHEFCNNAKIGDGYWYWNGVILNQETSHDYLHLIERIQPELFHYITSELVDMKIKGFIDTHNLMNISEILNYFEELHKNDRDSKGKKLIKSQYYENRIKFK